MSASATGPAAWQERARRLLSHVSRSPWEFERVGALFGLVVLLVFFSAMSPAFRRVDNMLLIATLASTIGIVAVGQTYVLLTGGIDLSVGSVVALTGLVAAAAMKYGLGPIPPLTGSLSYLALALGLLVGLAIGAGQGWLITYRRMPPFIVTLGTMVGLRGLTLAYYYAMPTHSLPNDFKWISDGHLWIIPVPALIMLALYALTWYLLRNTKFGRYCYAIGGNETAARLAGVSVDRYKVAVYAVSGLLAGLTGMILIAYIDGGASSNGTSYELYSIAAAIIGGVSLGGGVGGIWGTLIGVLIITVIPNGMIMLNALPWWKDVATGAIILLAVLIDVERRRAQRAPLHSDVESTPLTTGHYLQEVLARLTRSMDEHTGAAACRIYLVDRATGDLVLQVPPGRDDGSQPGTGGDPAGGRSVPSPGSIVCNAAETGLPVRVGDLSRRAGSERLHPDAQSALALPIILRQRVVGVVEVQSPVPDAFQDEGIALLGRLGDMQAQALEDAWLLESGWLLQHTRDALRHLWDDIYLGRSALAEWALSKQAAAAGQTPARRGEVLREMLVAAIASQHPQESREPARSWRGHRLLEMAYVDGRSVDEITQELHISRRQYFYDLKQALEALADALVREHQA